MKIKRPTQPKIRSKIAMDSFLRGGGGTHGGGKRSRNRRDRSQTKRALRAGSED